MPGASDRPRFWGGHGGDQRRKFAAIAGNPFGINYLGAPTIRRSEYPLAGASGLRFFLVGEILVLGLWAVLTQNGISDSSSRPGAGHSAIVDGANPNAGTSVPSRRYFA